jgi:hypothetical protein
MPTCTSRGDAATPKICTLEADGSGELEFDGTLVPVAVAVLDAVPEAVPVDSDVALAVALPVTVPVTLAVLVNDGEAEGDGTTLPQAAADVPVMR